jgi:hypothetical protein
MRKYQLGVITARAARAAMLGLAFTSMQPRTILAAETCDISEIKGARELHELLSQRAAEVVKRAMAKDWTSDTVLLKFVAENAVSDLGAGDVGRPLGNGIAGIRALAEEMNADSYNFQGWDYMNMQVDACKERKVTVQFTNTDKHDRSTVDFVFVDGRLISAKGWIRSFVSGSLR